MQRKQLNDGTMARKRSDIFYLYQFITRVDVAQALTLTVISPNSPLCNWMPDCSSLLRKILLLVRD